MAWIWSMESCSCSARQGNAGSAEFSHARYRAIVRETETERWLRCYFRHGRRRLYSNHRPLPQVRAMSTSPSLPNGPAAGAQIAETEFSIELPEHGTVAARAYGQRSEEHTSELQSPCNLVCRLLLEKKKIKCFRSEITILMVGINAILYLV